MICWKPVTAYFSAPLCMQCLQISKVFSVQPPQDGYIEICCRFVWFSNNYEYKRIYCVWSYDKYNGRINPKHYKSSLFASSHRRRWPRHLLFVNKSKSKHAMQSIARLPSTLTAEDFFLSYTTCPTNRICCGNVHVAYNFRFFWQRCIWFLLLNDEERVEIIQVHYAVAGRKHVGVSQLNSVYIIIVYYAMRQHTEIPEIIQ